MKLLKKCLVLGLCIVLTGCTSKVSSNDSDNDYSVYVTEEKSEVLTDDLSMDGITQYTGDDQAAVLAVKAGNDLLCCTNFEVQIPAVIYDRIRAVCQLVQVKGESQRKSNKAKMIDTFREIFVKTHREAGDI